MPVESEIEQARYAVVAEMASAVEQLRGALDAERAALDHLDTLALDAATSAKAQLLQRVESLDAERRQLDALGMPREPSVTWNEFCRQLEDCRGVNEVNGRIVEHQLRGIRRALGILTGSGAGPAVMYGPGGHTQTGGLPRALARA